MKLLLIMVSLLIISYQILPIYFSNNYYRIDEPIYFGVTYGGKTASEAKLLIDRVSLYTNLFIINSWDVSINENELNEICDYAFGVSLNFIVYIYFSPRIHPWHLNWLDYAKERWGDNFLGIYLYDEPGGKQIDKGQWDYSPAHGGIIVNHFENVTNQSEAANQFVLSIASTRN